MSVTMLLAAIAAAALGGIVLWATLVYRKWCAQFAGLAQTMRRLSLRDASYAPVDSRDPRDAGARQRFDEITRELEQSGCAVLGELMELREDGTICGVVRWFRDDSGVTGGWFGLLKGAKPTMQMFSESTDGHFVLSTRGPAGTQRHVARPPSTDGTWAAWDEGLGNQLGRHRGRLARRGNTAEWRRVGTMDETVQLLGRLRATSIQWRTGQPEPELLDQDLRLLLGKHYDGYGVDVRRIVMSPTKG